MDPPFLQLRACIKSSMCLRNIEPILHLTAQAFFKQMISSYFYLPNLSYLNLKSFDHDGYENSSQACLVIIFSEMNMKTTNPYFLIELNTQFTNFSKCLSSIFRKIWLKHFDSISVRELNRHDDSIPSSNYLIDPNYIAVYCLFYLFSSLVTTGNRI